MVAERPFGFGMMFTGDMMMASHPPPLQPIHRGLPLPPLALPQHQPMSAEEIYSGAMSPRGRRQREFIPEAKKDGCYWDRRRRNNEAAKRSREKRRLNDMLLERRVLELTKENWILKAQIQGVFDNYGVRAEDTLSGVAVDRILASMPSNEQILAFGNRSSGRRDSFDLDPPSSSMGFSDTCDEPAPIKRPKLEAPEPLSSTLDEWSTSRESVAPKSEDDSWGRETEEEEPVSRPPTRQDTDNWGPLNLSSSCSNSSDTGYEASHMSPRHSEQNPSPSFSISPCSSLMTTSPSPLYMLPHKLRFKHTADDHLSQSESDENNG